MKKYSCEKCGIAFGRARSLKSHYERVHEGLKKYRCEKCGKAFSNAYYLKRHNKIDHKALKKYKCDKCWKSYGKIKTLVRHEKIVHERWEKRWEKYKSKCDKAFSEAGSLKTHSETVHEVLKCENGRYKCIKCSGIALKLSNGIVHDCSVHEGVKKYNCFKCHRKSFLTKNDLKYHVSTNHVWP